MNSISETLSTVAVTSLRSLGSSQTRLLEVGLAKACIGLAEVFLGSVGVSVKLLEGVNGFLESLTELVSTVKSLEILGAGGVISSLGLTVAFSLGGVASLGSAVALSLGGIASLGSAVALSLGAIASLGSAVALSLGAIALASSAVGSLGSTVALSLGTITSLRTAIAFLGGTVALSLGTIASLRTAIAFLGGTVALSLGTIASLGTAIAFLGGTAIASLGTGATSLGTIASLGTAIAFFGGTIASLGTWATSLETLGTGATSLGSTILLGSVGSVGSLVTMTMTNKMISESNFVGSGRVMIKVDRGVSILSLDFSDNLGSSLFSNFFVNNFSFLSGLFNSDFFGGSFLLLSFV